MMFETVVGHCNVKQRLESSVANGKVSHAYIFAGKRGVGKTSMAKAFADVLTGGSVADITVVTSDNPRTEDPCKIIEDIDRGAIRKPDCYYLEVDRRKAIRFAMSIAQKDDIIVLAGKGHETYQEINGIKHHLDEREEVAAALNEMKG